MIKTNEMFINDNDIARYNARLLSFSVSGTTVSNSTPTADVRLRMPTLFNTFISARTLTITLSFFPTAFGEKGSNISDRLSKAALNISAFEAEIIGKVVEIELPDGFIYSSIVETLPAADYDGSGIHDVTYTFKAIRHLKQRQQSVAPNGIIDCISNTKTPFIIHAYMPARSLSSVRICGITITNINAVSEIEINSVDGIITENGSTKFADTDFIDFPYLLPGKNIIDCNCSDVILELSYTPVFI